MFNQWVNSHQILLKGLNFFENNETNTKNSQFLILKEEEKKVKMKIKSRASKLMKEMELDGMKSLNERVEVNIIDFSKNAPLEVKKVVPVEVNDSIDFEKDYGKYFKSSKHFDFRDYSSDFTSLKTQNVDGRVIKKQNIKEKNEKYERRRKVSFKEEVTFILNLKELYKMSKNKKNLSKENEKNTRSCMKKKLKSLKSENLKQNKINKKKLKKIIEKSIKSKLFSQKKHSNL